MFNAQESARHSRVRRAIRTAAAAVLAVLAAALGSDRRDPASMVGISAATFVVDRSDDDPAATACDPASANDCSLRGAILAANERSEASTIDVPPGTYVLSQTSSCTYGMRTSAALPRTSSQIALCVSNDLTIRGAGAAATVIDAGQRGRVLFIGADAVVDLRGVTLRNGIGDASFFASRSGGGIQNHGTLTLTDTVVSDNRVAGGSTGLFTFLGAIQNFGSLALLRTTVDNNDGGGLYNDGGDSYYERQFVFPGPVLTVNESTISNNNASGAGNYGGGIINTAGGTNGSSVTIVNSTIRGNLATFNGGGVANFETGVSTDATVTIVNSTVSANSSGNAGGGIYNRFGTSVHLRNVTVTNNTAGTRVINATRSGGGLHNEVGGILTLRNTLVAGNRDVGSAPAPDCFGGAEGNGSPLMSEGHNLIQNTTRCTIVGDTTGNITAVDPLLGPLTANGGTTHTHALLDGSPAIDAGRPVPRPGGGGTACTATDQRGFLRPAGAACDIGAYEGGHAASALRILPQWGGNGGSVITLISGFHLTSSTVVRLSRVGEADIVANAVGSDGESVLSASFDLTGRAPGAWDVVITDPNGASATLPGGFTVEQARAPELWTEIVGRTGVRFGRAARYTVMFGNHGNVDAVGVPLSIAVPAGYGFRVFFSIAPPPPHPDQVRDDWTQVPVTVETDPENAFTNVPLFLPVIPAGFTGSLQIELTPFAGDNSLVLANFGTPVFNPGLDSGVASRTAAGAVAYLQAVGVTVPADAVPDLEQYATTQYQRMVDAGRDVFISSLGTQPQIYSLSRLQFDLIFFAAEKTAPSVLSTVLSHLGPAALSAQGGSIPATPCTGVVQEGESCTPVERIFPPDIPPPPGCDLKNPSTFKKCKPTEAHCSALGTHRVVRTGSGSFCTPLNPPKQCPRANIDNPFLGTGNAACKVWPVAPARSADPNEKVGSLGVTASRFLASTAPMSYSVFFENLETATAPAQEVVITDRLDVTTLDLDTFSFGRVAFGDISITPPPALQQYRGAVDLRPRQNLLVLINAGLDKATGIVTWRLTAVDPTTLQFPDDPLAGFLPPNRTPPEGDGSVSFTIQPRAGLTTGATICNDATIVFDVNAAIATAPWCNTLDLTPPVSQVGPLPATQPASSFSVQWSGSDISAGVMEYAVFVSENGGAFIEWLGNTTETSAVYQGRSGSIYRFYSVARDYAGNAEAAPAVPDATTRVGETVTVPGDLDGDGLVGTLDLGLLRAALGTCRGHAKFNASADFDGDGCVTQADYRIWYGHYKAFLTKTPQ